MSGKISTGHTKEKDSSRTPGGSGSSVTALIGGYILLLATSRPSSTLSAR